MFPVDHTPPAAATQSKPANAPTTPPAKPPASAVPNSQTLRAHFRTLDLRQIKSGRDNLAANLCPELAGLSIQVIDTAANHNIPRTRGPGVTRPNLMATWTFTGLTPQAQICKIRTSEQIDSSQIRSTKSRD